MKETPRTSLHGPVCYLCHSRNIKLRFPASQGSRSTVSDIYCCTSFGHNKHGDIIECSDCGMVALKHVPQDNEIEQIYKQVIDPLYTEEKENRYLTFNRVMKDIIKYDAHGKLLDIGCYCGYFLDVASKCGFEVQGLELSKWASDQAREHGHIVHTCTLADLDLEGDFDLVTMWDVIEHLSDPRAELREISRLLKKDGYLFLSTINIDSLVARLMGKRWPWLMDMHIYYFTPNTVTKILKEEGFRVLTIKNYTHYISSSYFIKKLEHISRPAQTILKTLQLLIGEFKIPFNLGDNMMVIAKKTQNL